MPTRLGMVNATIGVRSAVSSGRSDFRSMRMPTTPDAPEILDALTVGPSKVKVAVISHGSSTRSCGTRCEDVAPSSAFMSVSVAEAASLVKYKRPGSSTDSYALITSCEATSETYSPFRRTASTTFETPTAHTGAAETSVTAMDAASMCRRWTLATRISRSPRVLSA